MERRQLTTYQHSWILRGQWSRVKSLVPIFSCRGPRVEHAADHHSTTKAARDDISSKCVAAGYRFWLVVHESRVARPRVRTQP